MEIRGPHGDSLSQMLLVLLLVSKGGAPAPVAAQVGTVPGCNLNLPLSHGDSDSAESDTQWHPAR